MPLPSSTSYPLPELVGQAHLTSLDLQLKKLRDSAMAATRKAARQMREDTKPISDCVADIEGWVEKLTQLAEEVGAFDMLERAGFSQKYVEGEEVLLPPLPNINTNTHTHT